MKLPSGREISIDSLADVAEMLATESFHLENSDEAEELVADILEDRSFQLSDTEAPFETSDIAVIVKVVRPVSEEIGGALAAKLDEYRLCITEMVEKEVENAKGF